MISVTILTKNNQETIGQLLDSVKSFKEVIVLDTGSKDDTLKIVASYPNTKIHHFKLNSFGEAFNKAAFYATGEWILSLDSDEALTPLLLKEIQALKLNPQNVYKMRRSNFLYGKKIRFSGWGKDDVFRLYHKQTTCFKEVKIHPQLKTKGLNIVSLEGTILHYPYRSIEDFLHKMQMYSSFFAKEHVGKKKATFFTAYIHGFYAFFKSYFLQMGVLDGEQGYIISKYNAETAFYKYLKLRELNKKLS